MNKAAYIIGLLCWCLVACQPSGGDQQSSSETKKDPDPVRTVEIPAFDADSAFTYIEQQLEFGPRVPNTEGHRNCGDWLFNRLRLAADTVVSQEMTVYAFDGTALAARNIIASFQPEKSDRILLFAHWDTRPFADYAEGREAQKKPIPGANDGGSGVGVLLEIARLLADNPTELGIDIILFDAEDYGQPFFSERARMDDSYCLGSQYWSRNPHNPKYAARYGILLDMVGAKGSRFPIENHSAEWGRETVDKVWNAARQLGHGQLFPKVLGGPVIDDHYYVTTLLGIPSVDIIHRDEGSYTGFGQYWHTHDDDIDIIDKKVLSAVGSTILKVIYEER